MPLLRKPSPNVIQRFLAAQAQLEFSYAAVGTTATTPPAGFVVDHTRAKLGEGERVFLAAKAALTQWEHFRLGWVEAGPSDTVIQTGSCVAVVARVMGFWWLNACRIVYVVNETDAVARFGFAYGTLPGHAELGEERFMVEWDRARNAVWYDILAFSRPNHPLARLGYPLTRKTQRRFAQDSVRVMQRATRL
ncbi:hypothetical protein VT84_19365 [Gemmata sp. SH-PL17]|uniref:DUF1990 family protein n=1 Tax=Gemmata sp. SH-PL17 TaxID=1630693 RepID=UPI0004B607D7|nr:DUF1990 domain-containing protein [Gemmata sp. SH-PL17]AMV26568.1 hypothetical protein VT84_19365 [Gemmata sp. SH-PL17]